MAGTLRRRGVAVTAFALASGTSLAAFGMTAPAEASSNHAPAYYQGVTSAHVLSVALNLPSALPTLPGIPSNLAVDLVGVTGNATHNALGTGAPTSSTAVSSIASGSLVDTLPAELGKTIGKVLTAKLGENKSDAVIPRVNAAPIADLNVGPLRATALTGINKSSSVLLNAKLAELGGLLNLKGVNLLDALQNNVSTVSDTVSNQLDSALATVQGVLNQTPAGSATAQTLDQVQAALKQLQSQINSIVKDVLAKAANTAVVTVDSLDASQSVAPAGNAAESLASVHLTDLNVLNGLLTVKGFVSEATATATGKPGGAHATYSGHAPIVQVGTPVLTATLDETGLNLSQVAGLPQSVTDQVNGALAQVQAALNTLLGALGVHMAFHQGTIDSQKSDGRYAAATGPWYEIQVASPTGDKTPLVDIGLGHNTTASVAAAPAQKIVKLPNPQQGALPHTGANMPLIGGVGLALLIGAAVLRRRMV